MTTSKEIDDVIAVWGNPRDALNVCLAKIHILEVENKQLKEALEEASHEQV